MKHVLMMAVAGAGVAEALTTSVSDPAAWVFASRSLVLETAGAGQRNHSRSKTQPLAHCVRPKRLVRPALRS